VEVGKSTSEKKAIKAKQPGPINIIAEVSSNCFYDKFHNDLPTSPIEKERRKEEEKKSTYG
jgi:hypothetical protein